MTHKHTPGPWDYADFGFIVAPDPNGAHPDIYIAEIASEDDEGRTAPQEHFEANANLIAAAPDMLEALEELLKDIVRGQPDPNGTMEAAQKAIAKARGES